MTLSAGVPSTAWRFLPAARKRNGRRRVIPRLAPLCSESGATT
jgi:hypothetical protein